jgi:hypothetical protein
MSGVLVPAANTFLSVPSTTGQTDEENLSNSVISLGIAATVTVAVAATCLWHRVRNSQGVHIPSLRKGAENVHSWKLDKECRVDLVRVSSELWYEIVRETRTFSYGKIPLNGVKLTDCVNKLLNCRVLIHANNTPQFIPTSPSGICNNSITEGEWCVTLINHKAGSRSGTSEPCCGFKSWGGHAVILIESIENYRYSLRVAHLHISNGKVAIGLTPYESFEAYRAEKGLGEDIPVIETAKRAKKLVLKMIHTIKEIKDKYEKEGPQAKTHFSPLGGHQCSQGTDCPDHSWNCFTWAATMLSVADIQVIQPGPLQIPNMYRSKITKVANTTIGIAGAALLTYGIFVYPPLALGALALHNYRSLRRKGRLSIGFEFGPGITLYTHLSRNGGQNNPESRRNL